ncbi:MAG: hypothetical protein II233_04350 [Clostridia bacterium]|nr:hypothetical protein [Clostridia bacterium]MEE1125848.1 hypothetical protein [Acutalibacteraceae bacterium]
MKKKLWQIPVLVVAIGAIWLFGGVIPEQIARFAGTSYVQKNFPEMELECTNVEWSDAYGDFIIQFEDKDGNNYGCTIGPSFFPHTLQQGLFGIESYYEKNYGDNNK